MEAVALVEGHRNLFHRAQHRLHIAIQESTQVIEVVDIGRVRRCDNDGIAPFLDGNDTIQSRDAAVDQAANTLRYLSVTELHNGNAKLISKTFRNVVLADVVQTHKNLTDLPVSHCGLLLMDGFIKLLLLDNSLFYQALPKEGIRGLHSDTSCVLHTVTLPKKV